MPNDRTSPDDPFALACDAYLASKAVLETLKAAPEPDASKIEKQAPLVFIRRQALRVFLRGSRDRRIERGGHRFSLDKTGVVHVSRLGPRDISPLGSAVGRPLLSR